MDADTEKRLISIEKRLEKLDILISEIRSRVQGLIRNPIISTFGMFAKTTLSGMVRMMDEFLMGEEE